MRPLGGDTAISVSAVRNFAPQAAQRRQRHVTAVVWRVLVTLVELPQGQRTNAYFSGFGRQLAGLSRSGGCGHGWRPRRGGLVGAHSSRRAIIESIWLQAQLRSKFALSIAQARLPSQSVGLPASFGGCAEVATGFNTWASRLFSSLMRS